MPRPGVVNVGGVCTAVRQARGIPLQPSVHRSPVAVGILCGAGAAIFWAMGFTAAKYGVEIGFSPADLTFHRCVWSGLLLLPLAWRAGLADLNGVGWGRSAALAIFGGPALAIISYSGFLL